MEMEAFQNTSGVFGCHVWSMQIQCFWDFWQVLAAIRSHRRCTTLHLTSSGSIMRIWVLTLILTRLKAQLMRSGCSRCAGQTFRCQIKERSFSTWTNCRRLPKSSRRSIRSSTMTAFWPDIIRTESVSFSLWLMKESKLKEKSSFWPAPAEQERRLQRRPHWMDFMKLHSSIAKTPGLKMLKNWPKKSIRKLIAK